MIRRKQKTDAREPVRLDPEMELLTLAEAAAMLRLSTAAIRRSGAGTERLTKVRQGSRFFLLRVEVEDHLRRMILEAKEQRERTENIIGYLRGDHPTFSKEEIKGLTEPYKMKPEKSSKK